MSVAESRSCSITHFFCLLTFLIYFFTYSFTPPPPTHTHLHAFFHRKRKLLQLHELSPARGPGGATEPVHRARHYRRRGIPSVTLRSCSDMLRYRCRATRVRSITHFSASGAAIHCRSTRPPARQNRNSACHILGKLSYSSYYPCSHTICRTERWKSCKLKKERKKKYIRIIDIDIDILDVMRKSKEEERSNDVVFPSRQSIPRHRTKNRRWKRGMERKTFCTNFLQRIFLVQRRPWPAVPGARSRCRIAC